MDQTTGLVAKDRISANFDKGGRQAIPHPTDTAEAYTSTCFKKCTIIHRCRTDSLPHTFPAYWRNDSGKNFMEHLERNGSGRQDMTARKTKNRNLLFSLPSFSNHWQNSYAFIKKYRKTQHTVAIDEQLNTLSFKKCSQSPPDNKYKNNLPSLRNK